MDRQWFAHIAYGKRQSIIFSDRARHMPVVIQILTTSLHVKASGYLAQNKSPIQHIGLLLVNAYENLFYHEFSIDSFFSLSYLQNVQAFTLCPQIDFMLV